MVQSTYGNQVSFITEKDKTFNKCGDLLYDFEGNGYQTVEIGQQCLMAENLNTAHYSDGAIIPNVKSADQWSNLSSGGWAYFNNNSSNSDIYGKLYNWYAVVDSRGLCPGGWEVLNSSNLSEMATYLGEDSGIFFNLGWIGERNFGGKLKAKGTRYWQGPNLRATNESGFGGLPGGERSGFNGSFNGLGQIGVWWMKSVSDAFFGLTNNRSDVYWDISTIDLRVGRSIRCVKSEN